VYIKDEMLVGEPEAVGDEERPQRRTALYYIPKAVEEPGCHRPGLASQLGQHKRRRPDL